MGLVVRMQVCLWRLGHSPCVAVLFVPMLARSLFCPRLSVSAPCLLPWVLLCPEPCLNSQSHTSQRCDHVSPNLNLGSDAMWLVEAKGKVKGLCMCMHEL